MWMKLVPQEGGKYVMLLSKKHPNNKMPTPDIAKGVHPLFRDKIDFALQLGCEPLSIHHALRHAIHASACVHVCCVLCVCLCVCLCVSV